MNFDNDIKFKNLTLSKIQITSIGKLFMTFVQNFTYALYIISRWVLPWTFIGNIEWGNLADCYPQTISWRKQISRFRGMPTRLEVIITEISPSPWLRESELERAVRFILATVMWWQMRGYFGVVHRLQGDPTSLEVRGHCIRYTTLITCKANNYFYWEIYYWRHRLFYFEWIFICF